MKRTLCIGDVVIMSNGQKFRVVFTKENGEDVFLFAGIRDWNVYFSTSHLDYGISDEIHDDSDLRIKQIMSNSETPTVLAVV